MIRRASKIISLDTTNINNPKVVQELQKELLLKLVTEMAPLDGPIYFTTRHSGDRKKIEITVAVNIITEDDFNEAKELILKLYRKGISKQQINEILKLLQ